MKNKGGRPTKYKKIYAKRIVKYFDKERTKVIFERFYYKNGDEKEKEIEVANELPTILGFCISIGIVKDTLHKWVKAHKEFADAYRKAKIMQEEFWQQNSLRGLYNPAFTIFMGKNVFGWKDKSEVDQKHSGSLTIIEKVYPPNG